EVRNGHAACVEEDGRKNLNAALHQHDVDFRRGGCVGAFGNNPGVDERRLASGDHLFQSTWDEHIHRLAVELRLTDAFSFSKAAHATGFLNVLVEAGRIDTLVVVNRAGVIE